MTIPYFYLFGPRSPQVQLRQSVRVRCKLAKWIYYLFPMSCSFLHSIDVYYLYINWLQIRKTKNEWHFTQVKYYFHILNSHSHYPTAMNCQFMKSKGKYFTFHLSFSNIFNSMPMCINHCASNDEELIKYYYVFPLRSGS